MEQPEKKEEKIFSAFHNVKSPPVASMTVREFYGDVKTEVYVAENAHYRKLLKEGKTKEAEIYKKTMACVAFSALFRNRRMQLEEYIVAVTGYLCLDWDDVKDIQGKMEALRNDPYILVACISPSGTGIKGVIETDCTDWKKFGDVYKQGSQYFFDNYGLASDDQRKDITGLCFIPADRNAIWNENNKIFHIEQEADKRHIPFIGTPIAVSKTMAEHYTQSKAFAQSKKPWKPGMRNAHIYLCSRENIRRGIPLETALEWMVNDYPEAEDFTHEELTATVRASYTRNEETEFGKFLIEPPVQPNKNNDEQEWFTDAEIAALKTPENMWLLTNFIRKRTVNLWQSRPGLGKSTMMRMLCLIVAHPELEQEFLGTVVHADYPGCIYTSYEDSALETKESFAIQAAALKVTHNNQIRFHYPKSVNIDNLLEDYRQQIKEQKVSLIVIDPFNALFSSLNKDSKDPLAQRSFMDKLIAFSEENDLTIVVIMHPLKGGYSNDDIDIRFTPGTGSIERCRCINAITELKSQNPEHLYLINVKGNYTKSIHRRQYIEIARDEETFLFKATGQIIPVGGSFGGSREVKKQDNIEKRKKTITEIFIANGSLQHGQFCQLYQQSTQLSLVTAGRHLAEMVKEGIVVHDDNTGIYSLKIEENLLNVAQPLAAVEIKNNEGIDENFENCPF